MVTSLMTIPQYVKVYIVENRKLKEAAEQRASEGNTE